MGMINIDIHPTQMAEFKELAEEVSMRSNRCYICGKSMADRNCVVVPMHIDRKERLVHSRCRTKVEKAEKDLGQ